jgi:hypothetical protein
VSDSVTIPFDSKFEDLIRCTGSQLAEEASAKNARGKAAKAEIERRKANQLAKKAAAPAA